MAAFEERCQRTLAEIQGAEAFIATNHEGSDAVTLRYLTGFTGEGTLLVSADKVLLLTDSRYVEQSRREAPTLAVEECRTWYTTGAVDALFREGAGRVAFASSRVTHHWVQTVEAAFDGELLAVEDPVAALRLHKSADEVEALRRAAGIADVAFEEIVDWIQPGMNEVEIALRLELLIRESGAEGVAFEVNVSAGENTALNHYRPTLGRRTLAPGDLVLVDFGACVNGYRSDMTRTIAVAPADPKAKEIYQLVLEANRLGVEEAIPGARGVDVDRVVRQFIAERGHGEHFGHGLGHGIGLEVHEKPTLSQRSEDVLAAGMVVTVEPGVYLPGYGGVRIEDDILITEGGHEVLTGYPKDTLIEVGS